MNDDRGPAGRDPRDAARRRRGAGRRRGRRRRRSDARSSGTVRDHDDGQGGGSRLDYSAHPTALDRLREVVEAVAARHPVTAVAAVHRVGHLEIGDAAVVVAAAAAHRGQAFDAARDLIDDLKATVPIWKHQAFADGDRGVGRHRPERRRACVGCAPPGAYPAPVEILWWLAPAGAATVAGDALGRPGRAGRAATSADRSEAAYERFAAAMAKEHPAAGRPRPVAVRDRSTGIAVRPSRRAATDRARRAGLPPRAVGA